MPAGHDVSVRLIGGPTAVLEYAGLRLLTDPTFDPPRSYEPRPGVRMTKLTGPAIAAEQLRSIDAVLLSHDHHVDNLDEAGRAYLKGTRLALTTPSGAERLGAPAQGLAAWESRDLRGTDGKQVSVTAVPAQHGPDGVDHLSGEVTGFYLSSPGVPTVYVSGDNASLDVVRAIVRRLGSAPIAILHAGAAQMPYLGNSYLTLSASRAAKAARILGSRDVIPIHFDGWAHFSQGASELRDSFRQAGIAERLRVPEAGQTLKVPLPRSLRVAVVGATGTVGRAIVREALARGHEVVAISRHSETNRPVSGVTAAAIDATRHELVDTLAGADVLIGAVSGRRDGHPERIPRLAERLLDAASAAGVPRLLWVGGAGSLEVIPGLRLLDTPDFPADVRPESLAQADALDIFRASTHHVAWTYFSPPAQLEESAVGGDPYLALATDALLRDEDGASRIALGDYARAAIDELEAPRFTRTRFTIAAGARLGEPAAPRPRS